MRGTLGVDGAAFKGFEMDAWNARAGTYGELAGAISGRLAEPLIDAAGVRHGHRLLDVGTGPGHVAERAAARGARTVGIDLAEAMLAVARERLPGVEFVRGDAEELPFPDGSFDAVVGGFVLNHLPDPERAVAEAARVLVPGGTVAFSLWDRPERMRVTGVVAEAIEAAGVEPGDEIPPGPDPYRFAADDELRGLLERAGFDDVAVETLEFVHRVDSLTDLWRGVLRGTVRTAAAIRRQQPEVRTRIQVALERAVEPYRTAAGLELPVAAKIGSAQLS
jgi:SAM-dependent methyltransferase